MILTLSDFRIRTYNRQFQYAQSAGRSFFQAQYVHDLPNVNLETKAQESTHHSIDDEANQKVYI